MDFLECDPPVDFTANVTAREESGYGCTKVSSYSLQLKAGHFFQAALHVQLYMYMRICCMYVCQAYKHLLRIKYTFNHIISSIRLITQSQDVQHGHNLTTDPHFGFYH